jgi:hypothetical protein
MLAAFMLCVALPIGELDMPSLMMHINDPATIKFMAGVSGAPAVTAEVPLLAAKPKSPPQRSALWEYQDTKIALPDRPSCHDMAAAGDCSTNKAYMLSQCILACQAVAAGGVAARPAPAAAAAKPRVPLGAKPAPLAAKKPATLTAEPSLEPSSPVPNMEAKPMKNVGERQAQSFMDLAQDLAPAPEPKYGHQIADEIGDLAF